MMKANRSIACMFIVLVCMLSSSIYAVKAAESYDCAAGRHKDFVIARVEPTETTDGYETLKCELCGREYDAILYATSHIWGTWTIVNVATCTAPGLRQHTCTQGAPHSEAEPIPALGHDYGLTVTPPTCDAAGLKTYKCFRCAHTYTEPGDPALGHDCIESITKEATCTEDGIKTYTCSHDSSETYTETILALGHNFGDWTVDIPAREGTTGKEVRVCTYCGEREERAIPALPVSSVDPLSEPEPDPDPEPENVPLFNVIDAVAGVSDLAAIVLFSLFLIPCFRTISKERRDYNAYRERIQKEEQEDKKIDLY